MDEKEKELEFSLDDIMREFGGEPAAEEQPLQEPAPAPEQIVPEPEASAEEPEPATK